MDGPLPAGLAEAWGDVLAGRWRPDLPLHVRVFAHGLTFPLQRRVEMHRMLEIAASVGPRLVFEIGADKGPGIFFWCTLPTVKSVIACEIRGTPYSAHFERHFPDVDFLWLPVGSYDPRTVDIVNRWRHLNPIDVLFIDGDKGKMDLDFEVYLPMMNPRGVVFVHDVTDEAPRDCFERIKNNHPSLRTEVITDVSEVQPALDKPAKDRTAHEHWLAIWKGTSCSVGVVYMPEYGKESR
jgi:hypothetical protein